MVSLPAARNTSGLLPPTGPPQKGLPGPFPGAPERIRIKFVGLLYQITHDLIMINRELDPKAQAPKD
jgi:hypothetical protein